RRGKNFIAVLRKQRLVRGDDVLAIRNGLENQLARDARAADQFDDDVDVRALDDLERVAADRCGASRELSGFLEVLVGDHFDRDIASRAAGDLFTVPPKHGKCAATYRTNAEESDVDRFHRRPSFLNISLMPRTACLVRASFSIIAKRTW